MIKKLLIGFGVLIVVFVLFMVYANHQSRKMSPPEIVSFEENNLKIEINYSRPNMRGRLIFGPKSDGALQPYGNYWRLGANEATEITINKEIVFNGVALKAGSYRLYAIPGKDEFSIGVNTELGKWGAWEPNYAKDLFTTAVPVTRLTTPVEQLTARIESVTDADLAIYFEWSDVQLKIPVDIR